MRKERQRDGPTALNIAKHVRSRDARLVEEHLVEAGIARHLAQRNNGDARLVPPNQEEREPPVLGHIGICARKQHAKVDDVRV